MLPTQWLLLNVPTVLLGFIVVGISILLALLTSFFTTFIIPESKSRGYNGVAFMLFGGTTLIYAILLTTILFTSWIGFNEADQNVQKEANCLVSLYRFAEAFPSATKQSIQNLLDEYTKSIVYKEWSYLARSQLDKHTTVISKQLWSTYSSYVPQTPPEQAYQQESLHQLIELRRCRMQRLTDSKAGVNPILWLVLIIGEMTTVASIAFFSDNLKSRLLMAVIFAILIGLIFFTILMFDYPFTGQFIISSEPIKEALLYW